MVEDRTQFIKDPHPTSKPLKFLRKAVRGSRVLIWEILLEQSTFWKDYEFGHHGCLVNVAQEVSLELLDYLLEQGAESEDSGDNVLKVATMPASLTSLPAGIIIQISGHLDKCGS